MLNTVTERNNTHSFNNFIKMEPTIRHDFSFPPKSNSLNNNNNNNRQQQNVGLSSSATAPIFSSYKFNDSSHMMIRTPTVSAPKPLNKYKTKKFTIHSVFTPPKHLVF